MKDLWQEVKPVWRFVQVLQGLWGLLVLGVLGYLLGNEVLSSGLLGVVFAALLPLALIAVIWKSQTRKEGLTPVPRFLTDPELRLWGLKRIGQKNSKFPMELWFVVTSSSAALVGKVHWSSRWIPVASRLALRRFNDAKAPTMLHVSDERWITRILVIPGLREPDTPCSRRKADPPPRYGACEGDNQFFTIDAFRCPWAVDFLLPELALRAYAVRARRPWITGFSA